MPLAVLDWNKQFIELLRHHKSQLQIQRIKFNLCHLYTVFRCNPSIGSYIRSVVFWHLEKNTILGHIFHCCSVVIFSIIIFCYSSPRVQNKNKTLSPVKVRYQYKYKEQPWHVLSSSIQGSFQIKWGKDHVRKEINKQRPCAGYDLHVCIYN